MFKIGQEEIDAVARVIEARDLFKVNGGLQESKKVETQLAELFGCKYPIFLTSGYAALTSALVGMGIGPGDEVIVPAYTYIATAMVVVAAGAIPVLAEVDETLTIDPEDVKKKITPHTKAIIPVDLGGVPCDYDRVFAAVKAKKGCFRAANPVQAALGRVAVMADTAHSFGATRKGQPAGSLADFSSFSFHAVKNFTTAEGGALTWRTLEGIENETIYKKLQLLSLHGQSKDALAKTQLGAWEYDIVGPWYKCNMTDVAAALGLVQMKRYAGMLERRKEIIGMFDAALQPLGVETLPHYTEVHQSSGHLYITRIPGITAQQRNDIIIKMAERGIATNVHYKPLPMHTAYKNMGFDIANYPNAYAHFANAISLPLHTNLTNEQVAYVIENYIDILKEYL